jgi:murein L,D-transpeptidase YafK
MFYVIFLLGCAGADEPVSVDGDSSTSTGCAPTIAAVAPDPQDARTRATHAVVVQKVARTLGLYKGGSLARIGGEPACWPVGLASGAPKGPKVRQGDLRTPEGWYRTSDKPWSSYAGAIAVHYPNAADADRGEELGIVDAATAARVRRALARGSKPPQDTRMGGEILIHGGGAWDWTLGCIALEDDALQAFRAAMPTSQATDLLITP